MEKSKEKKLGELEVLIKMTPPVLIHKDPAPVGFVQMGRNKKKKEQKPSLFCRTASIPTFCNLYKDADAGTITTKASPSALAPEIVFPSAKAPAMASASATVPALESCSQEDSCTQSIPDAATFADALADSNTIAGTISAAHTTADNPADAISKANHPAGAGTTAVEEATAEARADMDPIADINNISHTDTETNAFTDAITDTITVQRH